MNDSIIFEKDNIWSIYNPNNFAKSFELTIIFLEN
jgi:hypothetical protein